MCVQFVFAMHDVFVKSIYMYGIRYVKAYTERKLFIASQVCLFRSVVESSEVVRLSTLET